MPSKVKSTLEYIERCRKKGVQNINATTDLDLPDSASLGSVVDGIMRKINQEDAYIDHFYEYDGEYYYGRPEDYPDTFSALNDAEDVVVDGVTYRPMLICLFDHSTNSLPLSSSGARTSFDAYIRSGDDGITVTNGKADISISDANVVNTSEGDVFWVMFYNNMSTSGEKLTGPLLNGYNYSSTISKIPAVEVIMRRGNLYSRSGAFSSCKTLRMIRIMQGVSAYSSSNNSISFYNGLWCLNSLISFVNESGMGIYGSQIFRDAYSLKVMKPSANDSNIFYFVNTPISTLVFPEGISEIRCESSNGSARFIQSTSIRKCVIPEGVEMIGSRSNYTYASYFLSNSQIEKITFPSTLRYVGLTSSFLSGCRRLQSLSIPDSVTFKGTGLFCEYCIAMTSVKMPATLTELGGSAFRGCNSLEEIDLPDTLNAIGSNVFENCSSLESFTVPSGVQSIGDSFMCYCYDLEEVTLNGSLKSLGKNAFDCCYNLSALTIPPSLKTINASAFTSSYIKDFILPSGFDVSGVSFNTMNPCGLVMSCIADIPTKLADHSADGETRTITVGSDNLAKFTEAQLAEINRKGRTIA